MYNDYVSCIKNAKYLIMIFKFRRWFIFLFFFKNIIWNCYIFAQKEWNEIPPFLQTNAFLIIFDFIIIIVRKLFFLIWKKKWIVFKTGTSIKKIWIFFIYLFINEGIRKRTDIIRTKIYITNYIQIIINLCLKTQEYYM